VIVTFTGSDALFDNLLLLASPANSLSTIFEGHVTATGTTVDLGVFSAGTELVFELNNQVGGIFLNGPANRNPDDTVHAFVDYQFAPGRAFVGFEDLFGGGDHDYNDLQFTVSNVGSRAVPDGGSSTAMLMGSTVLMLVFLRRLAHR
jgi:hypothetical protein